MVPPLWYLEINGHDLVIPVGKRSQNMQNVCKWTSTGA